MRPHCPPKTSLQYINESRNEALTHTKRQAAPSPSVVVICQSSTMSLACAKPSPCDLSPSSTNLRNWELLLSWSSEVTGLPNLPQSHGEARTCEASLRTQVSLTPKPLLLTGYRATAGGCTCGLSCKSLHTRAPPAPNAHPQLLAYLTAPTSSA